MAATAATAATFRVLSLVLAASLAACAATPAREPAPQSERPTTTLDSELARFDGAELRYTRGQWEGAAQAYAELAKSHPRNAFVWFRIGNCHVRLNQLELAAQAYRNAQALDPTDGRFPFNLGLVRKAQAQLAFEEAQAQLKNNDALRNEARLQAQQMAAAVDGAQDNK